MKRAQFVRGMSVIAAIIVSTFALTTLTPVASASAATFTDAPIPAVAGTAQAYQTLTAVPGTWAPAPTKLTYQWYVASAAISGATKPTFVVPVSAVGKTIKVRVTGTRSGYTTVARMSVPTDPVAAPFTFELVTAPTITLDTARVGLPIAVEAGSWSPTPDSFAYQWYANGTAIAGAKAASFTPTTALLAKRLTVRVIAYAAGHTPKVVMSNASTPIAKALPFAVAPVPTMIGTYRVGSLLTAVEGAWSPTPQRYSYQWYANGVAIAGATGKNYTIPASVLKKQLTVRVLAVLPGYVSTATMSAKTPRIEPSALSAPIIYSIDPAPLGVQVTWQPNSESQLVTTYTVRASRTATKNPVGCTSPAIVEVTVSASNTLAVVDGLCVGAAYTVVIRAERVGEVGPYSTASLPAAPAPAAVPGAPVIVDAFGRDGAAVVTWRAGTSDGGAAVTGYELVADDGTTQVTATAEPGDTTATISGLTNGVDYDLTLVAQNSVGDSDASMRLVTPSAAYVPSEPQNVSAIPGDDTIDVSWEAPADDGGSDFTGYRVTYQQVEQLVEGVWTPVADAPSHAVDVDAAETSTSLDDFEEVTGTYSVAVIAINAAGGSAAAVATTPVSPTVVVQEGVVIVADADLRALSDATAKSLTWNGPVPAAVASLTAGDVLVGGVAPLLPEGLLREVVSISAAAGSTTVTTRSASFDDVFTDVSISANVAVAAENSPGGDPLVAPSFRPSAPGVTAPDALASGLGLDFSNEYQLGISLSLPDTSSGRKTELEGSVTVAPNLHLGLDVSPFSGVSVDASATTKFELEVAGSIQQSHEWQLGRFNLPPQTFFVGPVPVVVRPVIPVEFEIGGKASISVSASQTFGSGLAWSSQDPGRLVLSDLSKPLTISGDRSGGPQVSFSGWAALKTGPILKLYDMFGPGIEVALKAEATVDINPPVDEPWLTIKPSLEISAVLKFEAFGVDAEASAKLASIPLPKFTLGGAPPPSYAVTAPAASVDPGKPLKFTATISRGVAMPVVWGITGGLPGDKITSAGVLTPVAPAGRNITVTVRDASGATGQLSVRVGKPFDPPGSLVLTGNLTSLVATWTAPPRTGSGTISRYIVETIPTSSSLSVTSRTATISNLSPGDYKVVVRAVNSAGQVSSATSVKVYVGPPPTVVDASAAIRFPNPPGIDTLGLGDLQCSGSMNCSVLASAGVDNNYATALYTLAGATWNSTYLTGPPNPSTQTYSPSMTCPAAGWCLVSAIDAPVAGTVLGTPLIRVLSGGSWTTSELPMPPGKSANTWMSLSSACPTASLEGCVVVGWHQSNTYWAWTYSGGAWQYAQLTGIGFFTIDCPAKLGCVIAGMDATDFRARVAVQTGPTSWNMTSLGTAADRIGGSQLSCGGAGSCALVTEHFSNASKNLWVLSGADWTKNPVQLPAAGTAQSGYFDWYGIDCWAPGSCLVAGIKVTAGSGFARFAFRSAGGVWEEIAPASGGTPNSFNGLGEVECTNSGFCVYADEAIVATTTATGSTWTQMTTDAPVFDVACPPSGTCTLLLMRDSNGRDWASLRVPSG